MTWQMYLQVYWKWLDACFIYFVELLGRSAMVSLALIAMILLLRKTVFRNAVFGRGMIWLLLVPALFAGKLKFYYETRLGIKMFWWWNAICIEIPWVARIYMLGIAGMGIYIFFRRRKLKKFVRGLEPAKINGTKIYVSNFSVSPFTRGIVHPQIVIPRSMLESLEEDELKIILLHERVHIQLGHLWIYFLWDVIRVLLWPNLLLIFCMKSFRSDMEDICDRITIQKSQKTAYEYGKLLLKCLRLLKDSGKKVYFSVALAGETEYQNIKSRMKRVVNFRPYKNACMICLCIAGILLLVGSIWGVKQISYPRYTEFEEIMLYDDTGKILLLADSPELRKAFTIDDDNVYIDRAAMNTLLEKNNIKNKTFYVGFGGYSKLPGIGGGCNAVFVDCTESPGDMTIPYIDAGNDIMNCFFKYI